MLEIHFEVGEGMPLRGVIDVGGGPFAPRFVKRQRKSDRVYVPTERM
jgi:hypothetical protein